MAGRLTPAETADALPVADPASHRFRRARASLAHERIREYWKYTRPGEFIEGLGSAEVVDPTLSGADQAGIRIQRLAERVDGFSGDQGPACAERFPLADLAALLTGDALIIQITGDIRAPLRIEYQQGLTVPVFLELAPGVSLDLVEFFQGGGFSNTSLYVHLAEGARLNHASAAFGQDACHWSLVQVDQAAGSHYIRQQYFLGGRKRRTETHVRLNAAQAEAHIVGAFVVHQGTHLDQQLIIEHRAPATRSRQRFQGIGAGRGTSVFNGRIHIHPDAPGADAALTNRNLAIHPDAVINSKPELEIYTDDVRCTHGATVGQISEESLFYLRSRGLGMAQARRILCQAFIRECLDGPLAETAGNALLKNLPASP